jgi:hypothetical protein
MKRRWRGRERGRERKMEGKRESEIERQRKNATERYCNNRKKNQGGL